LAGKWQLHLNRGGSDLLTFQAKTPGGHTRKGRLKADIEQKLGSRVPPSLVQAIVKDCYELMVEFFINDFAGIYDLRAAGIKIHIYQAETRKFHHAYWPAREGSGPGPEILAAVQAEQVSIFA
jgi:hypothetical protein